ncbi:MAG: SIMPL domain-containing protein [Chloroflexota bacterium]|nr:SIMPL domain-containing protein [Chloroflexota bacterium]
MTTKISLAVAAVVFVIAAALFTYQTVSPSLAPTRVLASGSLQAATQPTNTGISVSGTGKVRVKPNVASASIGIEVTATALADATSQANTKMAAVIDKIKSMGVADKDIQTSNFSISPLTDQPKPGGGSPKITSYRVNNQVNVTVRKIDDLGKILDAAVAAGANNIFGISFSVDDPTPYQKQARAAAVKDAMDKASQLANAAGITLGKVIVINEGGVSPQPVFRAAAAPLALGGGEVPVETGELEIDVSVEMQFAIQ